MQQMNTYLNHGRLDYADDIGLLSSRHEDMQEMMDKLTTTAPQIGLRLNAAKTKLKRNNYKTDNPITVITSDALEEVQDFVYMGRKSQQMKSQQNMPWIKSERPDFAMLKSIWKSWQLKLKTKLRLCNSNVLSVLLYGFECWRLTAKLAHKLETFQNRCLGRS